MKEFVRRCSGCLLHAVLKYLTSNWPDRGNHRATLIIAPHPDDEILGCGLLLMKRLQDKETIHILYLTDGSGSHPGHPLLKPEELVDLRKQEVFAMAEAVGLSKKNLHFLDAKDGTLDTLAPAEEKRLAGYLENLLTRESFDQVFIPLFCDGSSEHEAAHKIIKKVIPKTIRLFEYTVWARWAPWRLLNTLCGKPVIYRINLPGQRHTKQDLLQLYASQTKRLPPWKKAVLSSDFLAMFSEPVEYFFEFPHNPPLPQS